MAELNNITVGCHVKLGDDKDQRTGEVRFIGPVHFRPGVIAGVQLDDPYVGSSDGSVNGWRYFDAPDSKAVFVKRAELIKIDDDNEPESLGMQYDTPIGPPDTGTRAEMSVDDVEMDHFPTTAGAEPSEDSHQHYPTHVGEGSPDDEDDKYDRWKRGMAAALEHELLEHKSNPDETGVEVNYALTELPHEEITKISKTRLRNAIAKSLPQDVDPKSLKLKFEDLGDYTEMKVTTDANSPEEADDLKWSMLDPIHVRKFNEQMEEDIVKCKYTYLQRHDKDGCCRWVKPCIACLCCWLLLLTLLLSLLFSRLMQLNKDVDDLAANGGYGNGTIACDFSSGLSICDQIQKNADDIAAMNDKVDQNEADIAALKAGGAGGNFGVVDLQVVKTNIDNTGAATSQCPSGDYEIISCWVYLPNHWWMFYTYTDPDPSGFPDCSCYCQHKDDTFGCTKVGAECRAQCAKFGGV